MKKILFLLSIVALSSIYGEWRNSLAPEGDKVSVNLKEFTGIVLSDASDEREKFAADMLNETFEKIAGRKLTIGGAATGKAFRFGKIVPELGEAGYRIAVAENGDILLSGGTRRGVINAVVALLEEDIGVRWYAAKEPPRIPECSDGMIGVVPREYQPSLLMREPFYYQSFDSNYEIHNRTNQTWLTNVPEKFGGAWNFPHGGFCHTLFKFLPESLFEEHPEYFALIDGKRVVNKNGVKAAHLCMTNPDVPKIVAKNAIALLEKEKNPAEIISISQNDGGGGFCQCEKCKAMAEAEGGVSGPLLAFVNQVADEIHTIYPNIIVETLAYLESFLPPKTVRPGKNVMIRLCTDSHAWPFPLFYIEESGVFYNALKKWNEIGASLLIWDYVTDFGDYPMPRPNMWVMDHNFDLLLANGAKGIMLQGAYQSPGGADAIIKSWIFAKRMWNPNWRFDDLFEDFIEGYYGAGAPAMREYYDYQKKRWMAFHESHQGQPLVKPGPKFHWNHNDVMQLMLLLEKALKATSKDPIAQRHIILEGFNAEYLRLKLGPESQSDVVSHRCHIDNFKAQAKEIGFTRYHEGGPANQVDTLLRAFECGIDDAIYRKVPEGAFRFCPHNVTRLWPAGEQTAFTTKFDGRTVLAQKGGKPAWSIQWRMDSGNYAPGIDNAKFPKGQKYKLRIICHADAEETTDELFYTAFYDHPTKAYYGHIKVHGGDLTDKSVWTTLESKPFEPLETSIIYISPSKSDKLRTLYVDHLEMVPCD